MDRSIVRECIVEWFKSSVYGDDDAVEVFLECYVIQEAWWGTDFWWRAE